MIFLEKLCFFRKSTGIRFCSGISNSSWNLKTIFNLLNQSEQICGLQVEVQGVSRFVLKGALSRIIRISLNSQNVYLFHRKPTNNGLFLLTIETVSKCHWLQMARMETDCNLKIEAKLSFHVSSKNQY